MESSSPSSARDCTARYTVDSPTRSPAARSRACTSWALWKPSRSWKTARTAARCRVVRAMSPWCHSRSRADLRVRRRGGRGSVRLHNGASGGTTTVFAVTRLRVAESEAADLAAAVSALLTVLAARPGFVDGEVGRSTEDGGLWALLTRWDGVGSYRRALSAAEVKIAGAPVWVHALDEPSVYVDAD